MCIEKWKISQWKTSNEQNPSNTVAWLWQGLWFGPWTQQAAPQHSRVFPQVSPSLSCGRLHFDLFFKVLRSLFSCFTSFSWMKSCSPVHFIYKVLQFGKRCKKYFNFWLNNFVSKLSKIKKYFIVLIFVSRTIKNRMPTYSILVSCGIFK